MHLNKNKISVFILSLFVALLSFSDSNAQTPNAIAQWIHSMKAESRENNFQPVTVFENTLTEKRMNAVFGETEILNPQTDALNVLFQDAPATMEFEIPVPGGAAVVLQLAQVNIKTEDFSVGTKTNSGNHPFNYTDGVHYRGIVKGNDNSIATISIFNNELVGMISSDEGTFTLGKMDDESDSYIFYNSTKSNYHPVMDCYTDESNYQISGSQAQSRGVACKVVKVYFECDYQMYLDHSSDVTATANYVTSLFNQVSTLYANENIEIQIQQIYVWTVTDPYVSYSTASALLPVFSSNNSPFTNGNLAHFLSTRSLGGGVAYLSGLCSSYSCFAVSMVYNSFSNVPTYSWSVEVVTHEMGHNLSSPHTHNCSWAGGPIDNCGPTAGYPTEGGCADGPTPTNGGTIMSYCHLVSGVGINFNNGFGPLPGNLIRNYVTIASCVSQTGIVPSGLAASNISNETATVTWNAVSGTSTYTVQYKKSTETNWTTAGTTSATTFNLVGLSHPVIYNWKVKTDCSNYSTASNFTTINVAACAKPTNLLATNITASSATISWSSVAA
ncbi:MAG: M12 family metallo-peptidase, partial [Bacteroidota bacterium]